MQEEVRLSNIANGELEQRFSEMIPALMSSIGKGQRASVSINITFARPEDLDTMATIEYSITPRFPAVKRKTLASITGEFKLKQDVVEKPEEFALFAVNGRKMSVEETDEENREVS